VAKHNIYGNVEVSDLVEKWNSTAIYNSQLTTYA
jgi:hypothetical protein